MSFEYSISNNNSRNINTYNQHYTLFCNNLNSSLQKELGIKNINDIYPCDWEPPTEYELNNSNRIIPEHSFEKDNKFKDIDMFYELTKDIRNLKPLNEIQLKYVKTLPKEKVIELLEIYNLCLKNINSLLENM